MKDTEDNVSDYVPMTQELQLSCGRKIRLTELSMLDYRDGEKLIGRPRPDWFRTNTETGDTRIDYTTLGVLIWLMSRKKDVSRENQLRGRWAFGLDELLVDFTERDFMDNSGDITAFFLRTQGVDGDDSGSQEPESSDSTTEISV